MKTVFEEAAGYTAGTKFKVTKKGAEFSDFEESTIVWITVDDGSGPPIFTDGLLSGDMYLPTVLGKNWLEVYEGNGI